MHSAMKVIILAVFEYVEQVITGIRESINAINSQLKILNSNSARNDSDIRNLQMQIDFMSKKIEMDGIEQREWRKLNG